jgi:uncharacterized protein YndB with AHSA1/START domain
MKNESFVIERILNAPVAKVWQAIANKDEMKQWYFDVPAFEPTIGFEFSFIAKTNKGEVYTHLCKVTEVIKNKKLTYSWQYKSYKGISYVSFELFEEGDKTKLKLTHEGIETIAVNGSDFSKEKFAEGWTYITTSLQQYLAKN